MSEVFNAIAAWEDTDKCYESDLFKEDGDNFKDIQNLIAGGSKMSADEKKTI